MITETLWKQLNFNDTVDTFKTTDIDAAAGVEDTKYMTSKQVKDNYGAVDYNIWDGTVIEYNTSIPSQSIINVDNWGTWTEYHSMTILKDFWGTVRSGLSFFNNQWWSTDVDVRTKVNWIVVDTQTNLPDHNTNPIYTYTYTYSGEFVINDVVTFEIKLDASNDQNRTFSFSPFSITTSPVFWGFVS